MEPGISLHLTGDDMGDSVMIGRPSSVLPIVTIVHDPVPVPQMPPAEDAFDNVNNTSQTLTLTPKHPV